MCRIYNSYVQATICKSISKKQKAVEQEEK